MLVFVLPVPVPAFSPLGTTVLIYPSSALSHIGIDDDKSSGKQSTSEQSNSDGDTEHWSPTPNFWADLSKGFQVPK
ncbi:unnamed protein product [Penicillium camemberti]|uniref:Str. FM013 n=1 Tax=Penicillium camemberti (strain FM 013) TaxID=1429867 RepID=A0A0G4PWL1_PENC3|nr:unnamed protein product [Penicillium camemberti]